MPESALPFQTIADLAREIRAGAINPVELTEHLLARAEALNDKLHAFIRLTPDRALAEARAAELALKAGQDRGPLHGIPFAAKDLFDVAGLPTTAGTHLLADNIAQTDCTVVQKLGQAGMVLLGKTHTVQFALGGVGLNHDHGTPHNPWAREHHAPGGSSSGTGVAVASGLVPAGLGSDTGGSVRIPAALCGTVGLKTTVGRVSRAGVYPLSWTLDSVGPLARSVEDAALVFQALQGEDSEDDTTPGVPSVDVLGALKNGVKGLRVAFGETLFFDDVDAEVEQAVRGAGDVFRALGAQVDSVEIPEAAEAFLDELRPMVICAEGCAVNAAWVNDHFEELDPVVSHRMVTGWKLSAPDYFITIRKWADLRSRVLDTLRDVDAVLVPTTALPARSLAVIDADLDSYNHHNTGYLRNTTIGNTLNLCAVSLPCGFTQDGLPIGLMVYAKPFQEDVALRVAYAYEQATDWHKRRPDLSWV
jgi:aspartyl-tRNA(Asn)/glutamyl-tRNA(Gln) amidotransferase subunit A